MKYPYDPEWDSPEARANFASRHIMNPYRRKQKRDQLLAEYMAEQVIPFPTTGKDTGLEKNPESLQNDLEAIIIRPDCWSDATSPEDLDAE